MHLSSLCNTYMRPGSGVQELIGSALPVVVFGTGSQGIKAAEWLEKNSIIVTAFCETSAFYRPGKVVCGKPVYEYEILSSVFPSQNTAGGYGCHLVFAASGEGIFDIWRAPITTVKKHYFNFVTPVWGKVKMTADWVNKHINALDETYQLLADDYSRKVFLSYIDERAYCLKEAAPHLYELRTPDEYFNDLYNFQRHKHHVLVDCGAYTGDSAEKFLNFLQAHGETGRVLAFEPDEQNLNQIKTMSGKLSTHGMIECFPYAVGEGKKEVTFTTGLGISSHCLENTLDEKNTVRVPVVAIDDILQDTEVSIIKMDVEGSELAALKGAKKLIVAQMPFLAICVYHRDDDLITIPQYIHNLTQQTGKTYRLYLRHHGIWQPYDTVLYAVPE